MTLLLLAEHSDGALSDETRKALTAALQISAAVDVLVAGHDIDKVAALVAGLRGVRAVRVADDSRLAGALAAPLYELILSLAAEYDQFAAASTATGKAVMPRLAAALDVMQVSDVIAVLGPSTFKRPIYAGNVIQTVESTDTKTVVTIRTSAFAAAAGGGSAKVSPVTIPSLTSSTRLIRNEKSASERPDLGGARVVVSGGRALGSKENFDQLILPLAAKLGAAVGASRAAVDAGYASNDLQVGQTGKVVAPDLYIAVGISGAIQHLAGMSSSAVVVAINKDGEAPIFRVADYGLVGDLFVILPELQALL